jgi:hypothetical protein
MLDGLAQFLFERPWRLAVSWVGLQFLLICLWSWQRTPRIRHAVLFGFAVFPVLLAASILVVTDRERVITLCRELALEVERGDAFAIEQHLADDFLAGDLDRDRFADRLQTALERYRVDYPRLRRFDVSFPSETTAIAEFEATARVRSPNTFYGQMLSKWRISFRRHHKDWLITSLEAIPTPLSPIRDLRDWLR